MAFFDARSIAANRRKSAISRAPQAIEASSEGFLNQPTIPNQALTVLSRLCGCESMKPPDSDIAGKFRGQAIMAKA
jgi:hypothetical protein